MFVYITNNDFMLIIAMALLMLVCRRFLRHATLIDALAPVFIFRRHSDAAYADAADILPPAPPHYAADAFALRDGCSFDARYALFSRRCHYFAAADIHADSHMRCLMLLLLRHTLLPMIRLLPR